MHTYAINIPILIRNSYAHTFITSGVVAIVTSKEECLICNRIEFVLYFILFYWVSLTYVGYQVWSLLFNLLPNTLKLSGFPIFWSWAYLVKVVKRHVVHTTCDVFVFTIKVSTLLSASERLNINVLSKLFIQSKCTSTYILHNQYLVLRICLCICR